MNTSLQSRTGKERYNDLHAGSVDEEFPEIAALLRRDPSLLRLAARWLKELYRIAVVSGYGMREPLAVVADMAEMSRAEVLLALGKNSC
jgi:hypothetical protein